MTQEQLYEATWESLNRHEVPGWFRDAKFGIFIHWGVYSVPAWAPPPRPDTHYYDEPVGSIPYAELYGYGLRYKDSPVWKHHVEHYGAAVQYEDFIPQFTAAQWNPQHWAELFGEVGAQYVTLVTRHSDDYSLWPTQFSARNAFVSGPQRDLVGDLTTAVRARGLKMGLYYSLTFDWYHDRYPHRPYVDYAHNQVRELIDRYAPDVLWPDDYWKPSEKSSAETWESKKLIAYFYNQAQNAAEVLVNDRWGSEPHGLQLGDYATPEYAAVTDRVPFCWELCRGIGASFGYNQAETNADYASVEELIALLVDTVSKNGNLLLNIGPTAEGVIPPLQEQRLRGIGAWLHVNGEAIYGTRPWVFAEGATTTGGTVRFTATAQAVYVIVLGNPATEITLRQVRSRDGAAISLLGGGRLQWHTEDDGVHVELPAELPTPSAYVLKITPEPWALVTRTTERPSVGQMWRRSGALYL